MKVVSAALTKSTDMVAKMDPFPILELQGKRIKGPTHKNGHKAPKWDWEFDYFTAGEGASKSEIMMKVAVWEEDTIT